MRSVINNMRTTRNPMRSVRNPMRPGAKSGVECRGTKRKKNKKAGGRSKPEGMRGRPSKAVATVTSTMDWAVEHPTPIPSTEVESDRVAKVPGIDMGVPHIFRISLYQPSSSQGLGKGRHGALEIWIFLDVTDVFVVGGGSLEFMEFVSPARGDFE